MSFEDLKFQGGLLPLEEELYQEEMHILQDWDQMWRLAGSRSVWQAEGLTDKQERCRGHDFGYLDNFDKIFVNIWRIRLLKTILGTLDKQKC